MCGQQLLHRAKRFAAELPRHDVGAVYIRIDHAEKPDWLPLKLKFLVDSGMIAPENTHADDGDRNRIVCRQEEFSLAGCRKEIVNVKAGKSIWKTTAGDSRLCSTSEELGVRSSGLGPRGGGNSWTDLLQCKEEEN